MQSTSHYGNPGEVIRNKAAALGFIGLAGLMFPVLATAQSFEIVDLGPAYPVAISENNTIVGGISETGSASDRRPFVMCDGCPIHVLDLPPYGVNGIANGISSNGEYVVGGFNLNYRGFPSGSDDIGPMMHESRPLVGFIWNDGDIETLPEHAVYRPVYDVNDYGQAIGMSAYHNLLHHNFADLWPDGFDDDNAIHSRAVGINNSSQAVGDRAQPGPDGVYGPFAVLWNDGIRDDLGTLTGYDTSVARAINEKGQVVGWASAGEWSHAVLWHGGMIQNLGTLPGEESSYALDINDHGQIVGASEWSQSDAIPYPDNIGGPLGERPFLWQCEQMLDLNTLIPMDSGWDLLEARSINNAGRIVGSGMKDGEIRGYVLKPVKSPARGRDQGRGNSGPPVCPGSQGQGSRS